MEHENDLGEIKPVGSRWVWPFREMRVGQFFIVDKQRRELEPFRRMAHVRGSQLGKKFSVTQPDYLPGYFRVECQDRTTEISPRHSGFMEYKDAIGVIRRCYGADAGLMYWTGLSVGAHDEMMVEQIEEPKVPQFIVIINTGYSFTTGVELLEDRVRLTALAEGTTLSQWQSLDLLGD